MHIMQLPGIGLLCPTGWVLRPEFPVYQAYPPNEARMITKTVVVFPARAAYSHSASVGRRYLLPPSLAFSLRMNSCTSFQETFSTGRLPARLSHPLNWNEPKVHVNAVAPPGFSAAGTGIWSLQELVPALQESMPYSGCRWGLVPAHLLFDVLCHPPHAHTNCQRASETLLDSPTR